jgi:hypothetical protein
MPTTLVAMTTAFHQLNHLTNTARTREELRAKLDKALIGVAVMVDLVEIIRPASLGADRVYDPEAAAAEALDLIKGLEGAAAQERVRIVAAIRHLSGDRNDLVEHSGKLASAWLADEIEAGRL